MDCVVLNFKPGWENMTVLNPRSRMVSVRLSEEEFQALRRVCSLTGARSVSELTREAVRAVLRDVTRDDLLGRHLDEFRAGMKSLEKKVEQLEARITTPKPDGDQ
jgi:hypothetical protein